MDTLTTTPERLAQVRQFIQDRRAHAAKVTAVAQNVERGLLPVKPEERGDTAQLLREDAALASAEANAIELALSILLL